MLPPRSVVLLVAAALAAWTHTVEGNVSPAQLAEAEQKATEPLLTLDKNNFGDRKNATLSEGETMSYTLGNGYKCALSGWTHAREYAKGYVRNTEGSAYAKVAGLIPGAEYVWEVYQFASHFKYSQPANILVVNGVEQGKTSQNEDKTASAVGISIADTSGHILFEFQRTRKQVHLSGLALAKVGPPCSKWSTTGWHGAKAGRVFSAAQSPDSKEWTWQQCASRCADELECDFWTLQESTTLFGTQCSMMLGTKGAYNDVGGHVEGVRDSGCSMHSNKNSHISDLHTEITGLKKNISSEEQQIQHLTGVSKDLEASKNALTSKTKELEAHNQKHEEQENRLNGQVAIRTDLLVAKSQELNSRSQEFEKEKADLSGKLSSKSAELESITQALAAKTKEFQDMESRANQLEKEKADLTNQLATRTEELAAKSKELDTKSNEYQKTTLDLSEKLSSKESLLSTKTSELESQTQALAAKTKEFEEQKAKAASLTQDKLTLENQVRAKETKIQIISSELADTTAKRKELQEAYNDPSVQHFLEAKAWKVYEHPGVYHTVNKTFHYVLPSLKMRYERGQAFLNSGQSQVYNKLNAFVGNKKTEPYLPVVSGIVVYGIAVLPFFCALGCLTQVLCQRRLVLIFFHTWFTLTCLSASGFAMFTGAEPLAVFAMHDAAVFLFSQVAFGVLLLLYSLMLLVSWCLCSAGGTFEPCYRMIQTTILVPALLVYCLCIWTPTIQDKLPEMDKLVLTILRAVGFAGSGGGMWIPYILGTLVFAVEGVLELLCFRAAKHRNRLEYIESQIKVRDLEELSALVPGKSLEQMEMAEKTL